MYYSMSGANLTLRRFSEAEYNHCLALGADKKTVAYPLGIARYLQKEQVHIGSDDSVDAEFLRRMFFAWESDG